MEKPLLTLTAAPIGTWVPTTAQAQAQGIQWWQMMGPGAEAAAAGDRDCVRPSPALQASTLIGLLKVAGGSGLQPGSTHRCGGRRGRRKRNIDEGQSQEDRKSETILSTFPATLV